MSEQFVTLTELPEMPNGWTKRMEMHVNYGKAGGSATYSIFDDKGRKTNIGVCLRHARGRRVRVLRSWQPVDAVGSASSQLRRFNEAAIRSQRIGEAMKFTGRVIDVGDMEEGRGVRVQVGERAIVLVGLTEDEARVFGKALYQTNRHVSVSAAARRYMDLRNGFLAGLHSRTGAEP